MNKPPTESFLKKIVDEYEERFEWSKEHHCYFYKNTNIKATLNDLIDKHLLQNYQSNNIIK